MMLLFNYVLQGSSSAYFSVFCTSSLPIHSTPSIKADGVYERNLGKPLLKVYDPNRKKNKFYCFSNNIV